MNYKSIRLRTVGGVGLALSNSFPKPLQLEDAIEDSNTPEELLHKLICEVENYAKRIELDRVKEDYIRYKLTMNMCNNIEYLNIYLS